MGWAWERRGIDRCGAVSGADAWDGRGMGVEYIDRCGAEFECGYFNRRMYG